VLIREYTFYNSNDIWQLLHRQELTEAGCSLPLENRNLHLLLVDLSSYHHKKKKEELGMRGFAIAIPFSLFR
jgi:hypothetical protein